MLLDKIDFIYEPYPIGTVTNVFQNGLYERMAQNFPPTELFEHKEFLGHKYSLSEVNNADRYHAFVRSNPLWNDFYNWIKRDDFPYEVLEKLVRHNIDLGVTRRPKALRGRARLWLRDLKLKPGMSPLFAPRLRTRFEFSMLPADGGSIKPHTDQPQKIITLVVAMPKNGEWRPEYGGGTEVMRPRDIKRNFNFMNNQLEFAEVETLRSFEYQLNQCVVFIKTFNSLHGVRPMKGSGTDLMRKTLTINIEQLRR
ncbi:MAG: 2OG-Fe(II) oxygenase [Pyrinomonadaceae bacterium]